MTEMRRTGTGGAQARPGEGGFSLVELLVVIAIIGILATTVTVKVIDALAQARVTKAMAELSEIKKAIGMFQIKNNGKIPDTLTDLSEGEDAIMPDLDVDPWGNPYEYEPEGTRKYALKSLGADGQPGGEGEDADIDALHLGKKASEGGTGGGGLESGRNLDE